MTIATDEFRCRGVSDEYLFRSATNGFRCALLPMNSDATVPAMSFDSTVPPMSSDAEEFRCRRDLTPISSDANEFQYHSVTDELQSHGASNKY